MTDDENSAEAGAERRSERKERVLHTRVPEMLVDDLKQLAESMKVPVSNLVRTALEETVGALSAVSRKTQGELLDLAARLGEVGRDDSDTPVAPAPVARPPLEGVVGFQRMTLARDAVCAVSGRALASGEEAYFGVRDGEGPLVIVAPECVPRGAGEAP